MRGSSIIVILGGMLLLSGCGMTSTKFSETSPLKEVSFVTPIPYEKGKLQEEYPAWFDDDGNIVYPIKPGTKEYNKLYKKLSGDYSEVVKEAGMPKDLVDRLDTETLLQGVEDSPFRLAFAYYDTLQVALESESLQDYGFSELLRREDAYRAAAKSYMSRDIKAVEREEVSGEKQEEICGLMTRVLLEEYLILSKHGYEAMTEQEREQIWRAMQNNRLEEQELEWAVPQGVEPEEGENNFEMLLNQQGNPWKKYADEVRN